MDDRKIEVLIQTIKSGSFSKAALLLNCTQSAVTQTMNSLENEIGCKVLTRDHSGVKLTKEGEMLLPYFMEVRRSMTKLKVYAEQVSNGEKSCIRIGAFSSISKTWLPEVLQAYRHRHEDVIFDIRIATDELGKWLEDGVIDVALGDYDRCKGHEWYPLMEDPYYAILPKEHLVDNRLYITQKELIGMSFIMAPMNVLENHLDKMPDRQINVDCDDDSTLLYMVEQGLGVTAMPQLSLDANRHDARVLKLKPQMKRILGVALSEETNAYSKQFATFLDEHFAYNKLL